MDSSLSRQTVSSLSIIPAQPSHRLTESMSRGLSLVVTSMLPALPTDSWLASEAHRRQMRRELDERERFPVAGHSTQPVALGVGRCNAGALRMATFTLQFKTQRRTN